MWLNTELTLYGGATPGATIVLGPKEVQLGPEGYFTAKVLLNEGVTEIPMKVRLKGGMELETDITISRSLKIVR